LVSRLEETVPEYIPSLELTRGMAEMQPARAF